MQAPDGTMSCFLRTGCLISWTWQDEAELVVAKLRAGLSEKGKAWRWRPKLKPHFAHSPDSWMCTNGSQAAT